VRNTRLPIIITAFARHLNGRSWPDHSYVALAFHDVINGQARAAKPLSGRRRTDSGLCWRWRTMPAAPARFARCLKFACFYDGPIILFRCHQQDGEQIWLRRPCRPADLDIWDPVSLHKESQSPTAAPLQAEVSGRDLTSADDILSIYWHYLLFHSGVIWSTISQIFSIIHNPGWTRT